MRQVHTTSNDSGQRDNWIKWFVGILISVLAAGGGIVALLNYIHPNPQPNPAPVIRSLTGTWQYTMKSNVSGKTYQGFIRLTQDGTAISGVMDDPGGTAGRTTGVVGTYVQTKLKLSRDTGMNTAQEYRLDGTGQLLTGTFNNVGDYPDSGTIEMKR
jgi:hypothetical protein